MKIALVSCTKSKQSYRCKAEEMYLKSDWFKKAIAYISQRDYDEWFVISAKYGLLNKNSLIEPYELTLNSMNAYDKKVWAGSISEQIVKNRPQIVDIYAGRPYRKYLIPLLEVKGIKCNVPLEGMGLGKQKQFFKAHTV